MQKAPLLSSPLSLLSDRLNDYFAKCSSLVKSEPRVKSRRREAGGREGEGSARSADINSSRMAKTAIMLKLMRSTSLARFEHFWATAGKEGEPLLCFNALFLSAIPELLRCLAKCLNFVTISTPKKKQPTCRTRSFALSRH